MPTPLLTIRLPRTDHALVRDIGSRLKREEGFRERLLSFLEHGEGEAQCLSKDQQAA